MQVVIGHLPITTRMIVLINGKYAGQIKPRGNLYLAMRNGRVFDVGRDLNDMAESFKTVCR